MKEKKDGFCIDDLQAMCDQINHALKEQGMINQGVINEIQEVNPQEVHARYTRGYQAWLADDYIAATADFA
jgi:hypothetical protein